MLPKLKRHKLMEGTTVKGTFLTADVYGNTVLQDLTGIVPCKDIELNDYPRTDVGQLMLAGHLVRVALKHSPDGTLTNKKSVKSIRLLVSKKKFLDILTQGTSGSGNSAAPNGVPAIVGKNLSKSKADGTEDTVVGKVADLYFKRNAFYYW
jgi:hypothetical protein